MLLLRQCTVPLLVATLALACNADHLLTPIQGVDATVRLAPVEGGCWSIFTPNQVYQPVDLPAAFRIDGLAVHVVLREVPDWASICMIGPLVHVTSIRVR